MASSNMHILTVSINEERMEEARSEAAEELGFSIDTENEEESSEIEARAISSVIETQIRGELVYNIYKHTCEPDDEQIAEMNVYVKVADKFIQIDNIYDLSIEELNSIEYYRIGLYFVFDKEVEIEDDFFISLSDECSEQVNRITYIFKVEDDFVYQGYAEGDYDTGYISNGDEEEYHSSSEDFPYSEFIVDKSVVTA